MDDLLPVTHAGKGTVVIAIAPNCHLAPQTNSFENF